MQALVVVHLLAPTLAQRHADMTTLHNGGTVAHRCAAACENVFLHETALVQVQRIRSKKFKVTYGSRQARIHDGPRRTSHNTTLWLNSPKRTMESTTSWSLLSTSSTVQKSNVTRGNSEARLPEQDAQHARRRRRALASAIPKIQASSLDALSAKPIRSGVNASCTLIALHSVRKMFGSAPEGAFVLLLFIALVILAFAVISCTGVWKGDPEYAYHSMPMPIVQAPIERASIGPGLPSLGPDRGSLTRVPTGAKPNAPGRKSDASSASPDSPLTMSRASAGGSSSAASSDKNSKDKEQPLLCPSLVVPKGMDLVFAIRSALNQQRQEIDFDILDLQGAPLCRVVVAERGERKAPCCGIFLQTLTRMPLAVVNTEQVYAGTGPPSLCRPNGSLFGVLKHDGSAGYTLKHTSGRRLLEFSGDFHRKTVTAVDSSGVRICVTEPISNGYQIRIGPRVDAGMVISCLLGIDKLEGFALDSN